MTFHCFFEQSGTFKNEFKKLGYDAYDYDILNDFGETDFQIDLFKEIEDAYERERETVFDRIKDGDQIISFFPCVRFSNQIHMNFQGTNMSLQNWTDEQKLEYNIKLHDELNDMYKLISKMAIVCIQKGIPLIIENPYSKEHYLTRYWSLRSTIIDDDRRERGDLFKKPTQYWFVNRKPSNNLILEAYGNAGESQIVARQNTWKERSMIHPDYANRFIREFII